jgi:hypothetical protein
MFLCLSSDQSVCLGEACVTRALGMCPAHETERLHLLSGGGRRSRRTPEDVR